jgi:4-amino-4-deoxychorismate lyase
MRVNGASADSISIRDRGFLYGDGVFRTMRAEQGRILHWSSHFNKLQQDCRALNIQCPPFALLTAELEELLREHPQGVFKLIVTRGQGGRGYAPLEVSVSTCIWDVFPLPDYPEEWSMRGVRICLCETRLSHQPRLAGIKHLNRLENVLAAAEWQNPDVAEGLLCDSEGNVIEGTRSNLFLVRHGELLTPDLSRCGVAGVQRQRVLDWAATRNLPASVGRVTLQDVLDADEVFLTNSVIGLWPVREFQQRHWQEFPLAQKIAAFLAEGSE